MPNSGTAASTAATSAGTPNGGASSAKNSVWDFTRRKRWPELLVNELAEAFALVLSPQGSIWFCSPAVTEMLGWRDEELIDGDLADLVNVDDRDTFQQDLADSIRNQTDMLTYARLKCKNPAALVALQSSIAANILPTASHHHGGAGGKAPAQSSYMEDYGYSIPTAGTSTSTPVHIPEFAGAAPGLPSGGKEVLFEIAGYPHVIPPEDGEPGLPECKCIFAVAKPYPSRNTAMLNTFLELKVENERLKERIATLRATRPDRPPTYSRAHRPSLSLAPPPYMAQQQKAPASAHPYATQQQQSATVSPIASHHAFVQPNGQQQQQPAYAVPVSMSMPVGALTSQTEFAASAAAAAAAFAQPSPYYSSGAGAARRDSYSEYGGMGLGSAGAGGGSGYGYNPSAGAGSLTALADGRRGSVSAMSDHLRRGSIDGGVPPLSGAVDGAAAASADGDDGGAKKKLKRRHVGDEYVCRTCGRTDSPEWRKGPLGPKTLCNACGLRWAKQVRKGDEGEGGARAGDAEGGAE